jgi:hypothetical protein
MRLLGFVVMSFVVCASCSSNGSSDDDAQTPADAGNDTTDTDELTVADVVTPPEAAPPIDSGDGFGAARTACLNEINKLRATEGHAAYALWSGSAIDTCVDEQATYDETNKSAHDAWLNNKYPTCNGNGQDECLGYGVTATGVVKCLDSMWAEKNQPNCAGCPACQAKFTQNCPNCDFYGQNGPECGHYVNMSADYLAKVDCGFSALGGWAVQNFSQ